jgi:hypothetical protein
VTATNASYIATYSTGSGISAPSGAILMSNPVDMPGAQVLSAQDLLQRQYIMCVAPSHVDQYLFHGLIDRNVEFVYSTSILA